MQIQPLHDVVSHFFHQMPSSSSAPLELAGIMSLPFNEKNERKMIEEFANHASVFQEKVRRQIVSFDREIEANKNLVLRKLTDRAEMAVRVKDARSEVNALYQQLLLKRKRMKKWKMSYERVFRQLTQMQDEFSPEVLESGSPLDGMRRNISRLLMENKDLSAQLSFMNKQVRLYEAKLRGVKMDLERSGSLLHERQLAASQALASSRDLTCELTGSVTPRVSTGFVRASGPYALPPLQSPLLVQVGQYFSESTRDPVDASSACDAYLDAVSVKSPALAASIRAQLLDIAGQDFFRQWKEAQDMYGLAEALQHMANITELDEAVKFVMTAICRLCECDRASYWVIDKARGIAWTKVADDAATRAARSDDDSKGGPKMSTLMIPVKSGLVGAAFASGDVLNIADAYGDARFNRRVDQQTEYRTRSVLCFPIVYQGQVLGVTQCINKVSPSSSVFSDTDIAVVKTLGSAMLAVLASCHSHEESKKLQHRRTMLMEAVEEMRKKLTNRKQLIVNLRERMKKLFRADECTLVLVYKDFFAKVSIEIDGSLGVTNCDRSAGGLIQLACESARPVHVFGRPALNQHQLSAVDLDVVKRPSTDKGMQEGDVSVHSWPILSPVRPGEVSAVIQWTCLDRSVLGFGDDGAFNENNPPHVNLAQRFLDFIGSYVEEFYPSKFRLGWTKQKHLQLKVRGMLSFSAVRADVAKDMSKIRYMKPPTNKKVIELWKRAKIHALEVAKTAPLQATTSDPTIRLRTSTTNFKDKMMRERQSMMKRQTVLIAPSSLQELQEIAASQESPFANQKSKTNSLFGNVLNLIESDDKKQSSPRDALEEEDEDSQSDSQSSKVDEDSDEVESEN